MQRSRYIRFDCDSRLLHGHMLVREDNLDYVRKNLWLLRVTWKETKQVNA